MKPFNFKMPNKQAWLTLCLLGVVALNMSWEKAANMSAVDLASSSRIDHDEDSTDYSKYEKEKVSVGDEDYQVLKVNKYKDENGKQEVEVTVAVTDGTCTDLCGQYPLKVQGLDFLKDLKLAMQDKMLRNKDDKTIDAKDEKEKPKSLEEEYHLDKKQLTAYNKCAAKKDTASRVECMGDLLVNLSDALDKAVSNKSNKDALDKSEAKSIVKAFFDENLKDDIADAFKFDKNDPQASLYSSDYESYMAISQSASDIQSKLNRRTGGDIRAQISTMIRQGFVTEAERVRKSIDTSVKSGDAYSYSMAQQQKAALLDRFSQTGSIINATYQGNLIDNPNFNASDYMTYFNQGYGTCIGTNAIQQALANQAIQTTCSAIPGMVSIDPTLNPSIDLTAIFNARTGALQREGTYTPSATTIPAGIVSAAGTTLSTMPGTSNWASQPWTASQTIQVPVNTVGSLNTLNSFNNYSTTNSLIPGAAPSSFNNYNATQAFIPGTTTSYIPNSNTYVPTGRGTTGTASAIPRVNF